METSTTAFGKCISWNCFLSVINALSCQRFSLLNGRLQVALSASDTIFLVQGRHFAATTLFFVGPSTYRHCRVFHCSHCEYLFINEADEVNITGWPVFYHLLLRPSLALRFALLSSGAEHLFIDVKFKIVMNDLHSSRLC